MNRKGFTLGELLVVLAIIGLLSTLAVTTLNSLRQKSYCEKMDITDSEKCTARYEQYLKTLNRKTLNR